MELTFLVCCDSVGIRTPNLRIRSAMLYPVELQSLRFINLDLNGVQRYSGSLIEQRKSIKINRNKKSAPVTQIQVDIKFTSNFRIYRCGSSRPLTKKV